MEIRKTSLILFLMVASTVFGASKQNHGADVELTADGATFIFNNNNFTYSFTASGSMSETQAITLPVADGSAGQQLTTNGSNIWSWTDPTGGIAGAHTMLNNAGLHTNTAAGTTTRGGLMYVNSTPLWDELAIGVANEFLKSDGTDVDWGFIDISDSTNLAVTTPITLTGDSIGIVNQGSTTTVLHGNAAGNASFGTVDISADTNLAVSDPVTLTDDTIGWDSTLIDDTTWSDGSNAANTWTFDVSGTDHTVIFGDGLVTWSHNKVVAGYLGSKNFTDSAHYTGFPNRDDTSLGWDDGTYTLTLTATDDKIWIDGVEYNINTLTQTVTEVTSGLYWFWITAPGGTPQLNSSVTMPGFDQCLVATVYWNTTTNKGLYSDERHWFGRDQWTHEYLHETVGARYALGLALTLPTTTTDDDFQLESGEFYDEDVEHLIAQQTACTVLYHNGDTDWAWVQNQAFAYKTDDNATTGNLQYNNGNTLTAATSNRYVNYWMFISGDEVDSTHIVIGSAQWTTLAGAESESLPSLGALPSEEEKLIYKLTYRATSPPSLIEVVDFRASSGLPGGDFIPTSHAALADLVWTSSNHTGTASTIASFSSVGVAHESGVLIDDSDNVSGVNSLTVSSTIPVITLNGQGSRVSTITGAEGSNHLIFFTNNGYEFFTNGNLQLAKGSVSSNPWDFQDNRVITTGKMEAADFDMFSATPVLRIGKDTDEHFALTFNEGERRSFMTMADDADGDLAHYMSFGIDTVSTGDDIWEFRSNDVDRMVLNSSTGLNLQALDFTTTGAILGGGSGHDQFSDFVGNEHIDHSGVSITAGSGLAGGGDLTTTRTLDLDINSLSAATIIDGDFVPFWDITATATNKKTTFANFMAAIDHTMIDKIGTNNHAQIDTAITASTNHIADNSQAHTDYMLNSGDTAVGAYTFSGGDLNFNNIGYNTDFQTLVNINDGMQVISTASFLNDIDVADASYFDDALEVNGKLTVNGGTDPPYVLIDLQTKEQIVMRCRQEIPLSKAGGRAIVNIIGDNRIKWFIPLTGGFYGEKVDEDGWTVPTLIDTWDDGQVCYNENSYIRYRYDRITDTIKTTSKTIYDNSFPKDKVLDRTTGEIEDK